jgi:DNA-binding response OmpR family regulator
VRLKVAVVDDDGLLVDLVCRLLRERGHEPRPFTEATLALESMARDPVDVLVCDYSMPVMRGDQLCLALVERLGSLAPPSVMISAGTDEEQVGRALDVGARFYIKKPFAVGELLAMVERAARKAGPPAVPGSLAPARAPDRLGCWRIAGQLGHGGMGVVYRGIHPANGSEVAIKVMAVGNASVQDQLRFRREFDILAALDHPAVARVTETGLEQGLAFFVMEYVPGWSLWTEIKARGGLPWQRLARIGRSVAVGLAYVHSRGVVHRDVKPTNIILQPNDATKLVDFGVARRPLDLALTSAQVVPGTPLYVAPENARGQVATPASDVFALGLTLHFALTGSHPAAAVANDLIKLFNMYAQGEIPPLRKLVPSVPEAVEALVSATVHPEPEQRPSAMEVARTLSAVAVEHGVPGFTSSPQLDPVRGK